MRPCLFLVLNVWRGNKICISKHSLRTFMIDTLFLFACDLFSSEGLRSSETHLIQLDTGNVPGASRHPELVLRGPGRLLAPLLCKFLLWRVNNLYLWVGTARNPVCLHQAQPTLLRLHLSKSQDYPSSGPRAPRLDCRQNTWLLWPPWGGKFADQLRVDLRINRRDCGLWTPSDDRFRRLEDVCHVWGRENLQRHNWLPRIVDSPRQAAADRQHQREGVWEEYCQVLPWHVRRN